MVRTHSRETSPNPQMYDGIELRKRLNSLDVPYDMAVDIVRFNSPEKADIVLAERWVNDEHSDKPTPIPVAFGKYWNKTPCYEPAFHRLSRCYTRAAVLCCDDPFLTGNYGMDVTYGEADVAREFIRLREEGSQPDIDRAVNVYCEKHGLGKTMRKALKNTFVKFPVPLSLFEEANDPFKEVSVQSPNQEPRDKSRDMK